MTSDMRADGARFSNRPWSELLPWLTEYRAGPPILADDEIFVNAWLDSSPAQTLTANNTGAFRRRISELYVRDRSERVLRDDFPTVPGDLPVTALDVAQPVRAVLHATGIDTLTEVLDRTCTALLGLPRIGTTTVGELVGALVMAVAAPIPMIADGLEAVADVIGSLDARDRLILEHRILALRPRRQSELAAMLGISRERVAQIERQLRARLRENVDTTAHLRGLHDEMVGLATPVIAIEDLIDELPSTGMVLPGSDIPVWWVVAAASTRVEIVDEWLVCGDLRDATERTRQVVDAASSPEGTASVGDVAARLGMSPDRTQQWLRRTGFTVLGKYVVTSASSTADLVAAVLSIADRPLSLDDIVAAMGAERRAASSVRNALVSDNRIVKTDRARYGLARWGGPPYLPVHRQIAQIVDEAGGSVALSEVIETIRSRYDVTETSIRAYAAAGEFRTENDIVSRRDRPQRSRRTPTRTRGLYREGDTVHWSTTITTAHLKGSGFGIPSALADILGVGPDAPRTLETRYGKQPFTWASVQARSGSIKRFVTELELDVGDRVFFDVTPTSFDVRRAVTTTGGTPTAQILTRVGRRAVRMSATRLRGVLAEALWLPDDADADNLVAVLRRRRDDELAELVAAALSVC